MRAQEEMVFARRNGFPVGQSSCFRQQFAIAGSKVVRLPGWLIGDNWPQDIAQFQKEGGCFLAIFSIEKRLSKNFLKKDFN